MRNHLCDGQVGHHIGLFGCDCGIDEQRACFAARLHAYTVGSVDRDFKEAGIAAHNRLRQLSEADYRHCGVGGGTVGKHVDIGSVALKHVIAKRHADCLAGT